MNLLIINTLLIPSGQASVNRILSLGKGLVEKGNQVTIISSAKGEDTEFHVINGISYSNMASKNSRILGLIESLFKFIKFIRVNRNSVDVLWVVSNSPLLIVPLWITCKIYRVKYIMEKSEFPFVLMRKGWMARIWGTLYVNTIYKLFDGMIIMTQPLMDYFKKLVRKDCALIKIPMTVDMSRFDDVDDECLFGDYIAYCGNMSGNKDGVENLIEAFSYVEPRFPDYKLVMIGGADTKEEFDRIRDRVQKLNLKNVLFTNRIAREKIPGLLKNAKVLCLARPSSLQSTGGFPTKLGEYLSTGNPVVVTAVGEIPQYLNATNAFVVKPDDNEAFANAILSVLSDYKNAKKIGAEGKKLAEAVFNYQVQSQRLHVFLNKEL